MHQAEVCENSTIVIVAYTIEQPSAILDPYSCDSLLFVWFLGWCAGGVRCLSTLNLSFMITYVLLSIFLGIFTLRLGTSCSVALFWCYEVACWGLVVLLGATAFFLQRKAAVIMDAGEYYGHHERGVELLEAIAITPEMEDRVEAGFKSWMGPPDGVLSDDGESGVNDGLDDVWEGDATEYLEASEHLSKSMIG